MWKCCLVGKHAPTEKWDEPLEKSREFWGKEHGVKMLAGEGRHYFNDHMTSKQVNTCALGSHMWAVSWLFSLQGKKLISLQDKSAIMTGFEEQACQVSPFTRSILELKSLFTPQSCGTRNHYQSKYCQPAARTAGDVCKLGITAWRRFSNTDSVSTTSN